MSRRLPAALMLLLAVGAEAQAGKMHLRFVDDRGEAITSGLAVCFQIETRMECKPLAGVAPMEVLAGAASIRVEGPGHGPVLTMRGALKAGPDGQAVLTVPRKALLEFAASAGSKLAVSLYRADDATFRAPVFRKDVNAGETVRIPAGDHLVSIVGPGDAPDLHFLATAPGSRHKLAYRPRPGWSVVLRCLADRDGAPLEKAAVEIRGTEGYASPGAPPRKAVAGKGGLALVSGLPHALASATVESAGFALRREEGLAATPGTFAFREVRLEKAATLRAAVRAQGKPAPDILCRVIEYEANPRGPAPEPTVHFESRTHAAGICRSGPIPPGSYRLRLSMPGNRSRLDHPVELVAGEETAMEVELASIRVHGTALLGSQPAVGYHVSFADAVNLIPNATRRDSLTEAVTDEEGKYEAVLWAPGDYSARLDTPGGTPAYSKQVALASEEEQVDFLLEEHGVRGIVVDEQEKPVAGARVNLAWNEWNQRTHRLAATDDQGAFMFPLTQPGEGEIRVLAPGYTSPPPERVVYEPSV